MTDLLNAGSMLQYLWQMRSRLEPAAQFDLGRTQRALSTFELAQVVAPASHTQPSLSDVEQHIVDIYHRLLQRGMPTLSSLLVERTLCAAMEQVIPIKEECDTTGSFRFRHGVMNRQREADWLEMLVRAHLVVDPRLHPATRSVDEFDSETERYFYRTVLPQAIGPAATLLVKPQRPFISVLPPEKQAAFSDQRLDFVLETGNLQVVFEVDGPEHEAPAQRSLDRKRDDVLLKAGWRTYRTLAREVHSPGLADRLRNRVLDKDPMARLADVYTRPLWDSDLGLAALQLVLAPYAVARIQRALLIAIEEGHLRLDQDVWRLVIVERDVCAGKLAVADFVQHLAAFYELWNIEHTPPHIELRIIGTEEFAGARQAVMHAAPNRASLDVSTASLEDPPEDFFDGSLFLDVAMLQATGFTRLDADLINRHLTTEGAAYAIRSSLYARDVRRISRSPSRPYPMRDDAVPSLRFFLHNLFRKQEFRDKQVDILRRALALKPVIGLLPTGAGKSLCYQLAMLLQPGLTLVIVPINSLMMDQVDNLNKKLAIDWIGYINSQIPADEKQRVQQRMADGELALLFISPERLQSREFRACLSEASQSFTLPYAVIDEAHCVSEWGHDFRTSYLKLAQTIRTYGGRKGHVPTIIALTGTASFAVLSDVQREIGVEDEDAKIYPQSFDRKELRFGIVKAASPEKKQALRQLLEKLPVEFGVDAKSFYTPTGNDETTYAGIVFVPHTNGNYGVNEVRERIQAHIRELIPDHIRELIPDHMGIQVELFSGQEPKFWNGQSFDAYKMKTQRGFKENEFPLLVATKAFGMGVDKPNVRYTIHYNISQSLEGFYQEAGRAGRDWKESQCWVIFSDDRPEEADAAFKQDTTLEKIQKIAGVRNAGDIQRLLYLQQLSYPGVEPEHDTIKDVWVNCLSPKLPADAYSQEVDVLIDFGRYQVERDKALYRLSLLGVVLDYTIDYRREQFEVTATRLHDQDLVANLQQYISRYKTREITDRVAQEVDGMPDPTVLGKCTRYLLDFVYNEIERKRRVAIQSMAEVARQAAGQPTEADAIIRSQLLAYLEESPFTKSLEQIVRKLDPQAWFQVLTLEDETGTLLLRSVDGARQLLGGCRRMLESYPDDAGLLFLTSLARLLLPEPDLKQAMNEGQRAFEGLTLRPPQQVTRDLIDLLDAYRQFIQHTRDFGNVFQALAEAALEANPSRELARHLYRDAPEKSRTLLLNLTLASVRTLADQLCVPTVKEELDDRAVS